MKIYMETERMILRSWEESDREPFAELNGNVNVMKYFPEPLTPEESDAFVNRIVAELEECGVGLFAVELKDTKEFIGYVGFHRFSFDAPFAPGWEIGWRISDRFRHKGYATEAAKRCLEFAAEKRFCEKLYSFTAVHNIPSENVMKRIGMTYEGRFMHPALPESHWLREHKLYSINLRPQIVRCRKEDYATLAGIWERAARATHDFLEEEDFNEIKSALVRVYFPNVELYAAVDNGVYVGFIGLSGDRIEMLFVDNGYRGRGYGSALIGFAKRRGATNVDVNEQNPAALGFYLSKGFGIVSRDETDESGRPYPILHLSL